MKSSLSAPRRKQTLLWFIRSVPYCLGLISNLPEEILTTRKALAIVHKRLARERDHGTDMPVSPEHLPGASPTQPSSPNSQGATSSWPPSIQQVIEATQHLYDVFIQGTDSTLAQTLDAVCDPELHLPEGLNLDLTPQDDFPSTAELTQRIMDVDQVD